MKISEKLIGEKAEKNFMDMQDGDVVSTYADTSGLINDFDYKPDTDLTDGIGKFVKWYKEFFNKIFVKNEFLDQLLGGDKYFLLGEKGTGKTAFAVFLANNNYKESISKLKYIRETEYDKFLSLKKSFHLGLSDFCSLWKVILLLLISFLKRI